MSWENLIFFVLVLFVWGISIAGRWLQEQMAKNSSKGIEFEPIDWSAGHDIEPVPETTALVSSQESQHPIALKPEPRKTLRHQKMVRLLGLHSPQTLRQGIIILAVLGPCRALEKPNDTNPF